MRGEKGGGRGEMRKKRGEWWRNAEEADRWKEGDDR